MLFTVLIRYMSLFLFTAFFVFVERDGLFGGGVSCRIASGGCTGESLF
jgi:hypothetical protein